VYAVGETATFKPERRTLTKTDRLTIRAEVLPDDPDWHTGRMPTLIHTLALTGPRARGLVFGMWTEANHVTIRGLKLLGAPVVETPKPGMLVRVYPIGRMGRQLDDLEIAPKDCCRVRLRSFGPGHLRTFNWAKSMAAPTDSGHSSFPRSPLDLEVDTPMPEYRLLNAQTQPTPRRSKAEAWGSAGVPC
jgi:hypothetical protein